MSYEQSILEGPETPAPVFAYRAFKSYFLGSPSPDASPDQRHPKFSNKENIPIPARSSSSPSKSTSTKALDIAPHKRDTQSANAGRSGTVLLSPTKGILKTPGQLQSPFKNLSVKFDRVSPETLESVDLKPGRGSTGDAPLKDKSVTSKDKNNGRTGTGNPPNSASQPLSAVARDIPITQSNGKQPTSSTSSSRSSRRTSAPVAVTVKPSPGKEITRPQSMTVPTTITATSFTTYQNQHELQNYTSSAQPTNIPYQTFLHFKETTEAETKKLISYNRKMRDYARERDVECTDAKLLIQKLQIENEVLRSAKRGAKSHVNKNGMPGVSSGVDDPVVQNLELKQKNLVLEESERTLKQEVKNLKAEIQRLKDQLQGQQPENAGTSQKRQKKGKDKDKMNDHDAHHTRSQGKYDHYEEESDLEQRPSDRMQTEYHASQPHRQDPTPSSFLVSTPTTIHNPRKLQTQRKELRRKDSHAFSSSKTYNSSSSSAAATNSAPQQIVNNHIATIPIPKIPPSTLSHMDASRAAAARERLRQRSESRKASAASNGNANAHEGRMSGGVAAAVDQEDDRLRDKESQLDWENL